MEIQKKKESLGIRLWKNMKKNWILYVMIAPVAVYYIVFAYTPMYGILLAFKNYKVKLGILGSPWWAWIIFSAFSALIISGSSSATPWGSAYTA